MRELLSIDPLGFAIGIMLVIGGVLNFVRRDEVAARLANYYARGRAPAQLPRVLRARWRIRETMVIAWVVTISAIGVGVWSILQSSVR